VEEVLIKEKKTQHEVHPGYRKEKRLGDLGRTNVDEDKRKIGGVRGKLRVNNGSGLFQGIKRKKIKLRRLPGEETD